MQLVSFAIYLFAGYLVGIWIAGPGLFSWTVAATAWGNILVYAYMLFWPLILMWYAFIFVIIAMAVGFVLYIIFDFVKQKY